ncbi:MAG: ferrous iron transport protein B [Agathobacter sp.]
MTLENLSKGQTAKITAVGGDGALRQHFLDMGVIPGVEISFVKLAPMGDPIEFQIHGYELTLRVDDAKEIECELAEPRKEEESKVIIPKEKSEHPGLGEGGRFHSKEHENPLPKDEILTFALVGNQNCGKTTLFNQLTGSNQHVGNFPGVTVDRKDGKIRGVENTLVTDLPGIYSMSPYTNEEIVSRNFVLNEKPKAIINIVDATNIERNLYLTMQLLELNIPMVVALNMMDEVRGNGGYIDINRMESMLGVPVIPISAAKNEGVDELISHAVHVAKYQERPGEQDFCDENDHNGAVHRCLHAVIHLIQDHATAAEVPVRFAASKVIEGDLLIEKLLQLDQNEKEMLEHIKLQLESERGLDSCAAIADMRYSFIHKVCSKSVKKPAESREHARSQKIDRILTGKYTAIPMFAIIMITVFILTFNVIGAWLQGLLEMGIDALTALVDEALTTAHVNAALHGLVIDGIFAGVGSVLSFLPVIVTLFFFLSILEDSGYIARVAFFMDKLLRKIGLSGRSIVPMLIGFGCTVPAVMATRTLPSERDRKMTILMTPFMSCTAKLPIYAFFVSAFFPGKGGLIMGGLYFLGIVVGILVALLYKGTLFKGEAVPFVMELPNYRLPGAKNVMQLLWEKAKDFLQRAFSIILLATIVIWFLQSFDLKLNLVEDSADSILAMISSLMVPILAPLGMGDWRIATSLVSGFIAKESVVSTMEILFGEGIEQTISSLTAASLLVFSLLYTPCVAAISSIRRELGRKWAVGVVLWQCAIAWLAAFIVHIIGILL